MGIKIHWLRGIWQDTQKPPSQFRGSVLKTGLVLTEDNVEFKEEEEKKKLLALGKSFISKGKKVK